MAKIIWSEPALRDLDAIADYIAFDNPEAARRLVQRIIKHVEQLQNFPLSGSKPKELGKTPYRQIIEPPCRIFYRVDAENIFIVHVMRGEMQLRKKHLRRSEQ